MTVKPLVESFLLQRGLVLSPEKTVITHVREGFDFLRENVRVIRTGSSQSSPLEEHRDDPFQSEADHTRDTGRAAHVLINRLNPVIRGWANYHRHVVSKRIFARLDAAYSARHGNGASRHPRKGRRWIKQKYFERVGNRDRRFSVSLTGQTVGSIASRLFHASSAKIVRHIQVRSGLNPYDPSWKPYLTRRTVVAPHRTRS